MILRFAKEDDMDTSYAAWKLRTPAPYSIRAVTKARVAKMPLPQWADYLDRHPDLKDDFEYEVMFLMSEVMAHTITLHLLDAPGRVHRFVRKHSDLAERVPKKELASYLNLSAETLSRLKHAGKICPARLLRPAPGTQMNADRSERRCTYFATVSSP